MLSCQSYLSLQQLGILRSCKDVNEGARRDARYLRSCLSHCTFHTCPSPSVLEYHLHKICVALSRLHSMPVGYLQILLEANGKRRNDPSEKDLRPLANNRNLLPLENATETAGVKVFKLTVLIDRAVRLRVSCQQMSDLFATYSESLQGRAGRVERERREDILRKIQVTFNFQAVMRHNAVTRNPEYFHNTARLLGSAVSRSNHFLRTARYSFIINSPRLLVDQVPPAILACWAQPKTVYHPRVSSTPP
eukprot:750331-Hanusia_phi.AAC.2